MIIMIMMMIIIIIIIIIIMPMAPTVSSANRHRAKHLGTTP